MTNPCHMRSRDRQRLKRFLLLALLCLGWVELQAQQRESAEKPYWQGSFQQQGRVWDIGAAFDPTKAPANATLDSVSTYTSGMPPKDFVYHGDMVSFELPWELGRFEGRMRADAIRGEVVLETGASAPLVLQRTQRVSISTEALEIVRGEVTVAGTLVLPPGKGNHPAVVLLHGGGDSTRENVKFFAEYLARAGIACLIYDKRGNGVSTGNWKTVGFDARARDVVAGLDLLAVHPRIDPSRMGLLAFSQGSWVAGIAADLSPRVAYVVNISGPAVTPLEADTYSLLSELRREGWSQEAIEERLNLWRLSTAVTREPDADEQWSRLLAAIDSVREHTWFQAHPYEPQRTGWFRTWYRLVLDHDPLPILRRLDIPMLWVYGERDGESDPIHNVSIINQLHRDLGKPYRVEVFEAAGHGLVVPVDALGRDLDLPGVAPGYLELLVDWINGQRGDD